MYSIFIKLYVTPYYLLFFYQADARLQNCACGPLTFSLKARDKVSNDASKLGVELSYLKLLAVVAVRENPFSPHEHQEGRCDKNGAGDTRILTSLQSRPAIPTGHGRPFLKIIFTVVFQLCKDIFVFVFDSCTIFYIWLFVILEWIFFFWF